MQILTSKVTHEQVYFQRAVQKKSKHKQNTLRENQTNE